VFAYAGHLEFLLYDVGDVDELIFSPVLIGEAPAAKQDGQAAESIKGQTA
jgi:hypothetical protein